MKCLVKPKTPFLFLLAHGEVIEAFRPSLVTVSAVVNSKLAAGDLNLLGVDIPDAVMDADFLTHWRACRVGGVVDEALAVDSFMSQFLPVVLVAAPPVTPVAEVVEPPAEVVEAAPSASKKHRK